MFNHLIKDFQKKLEAIEQRLAVSLDRDEIQTLGLKLRFYYNEIRHYQQSLLDIHNRIIDTQEKYGFVPEENAAQTPVSSDPAGQKNAKEENVVELVKDWITRLENQGVDPAVLIRGAAVQQTDNNPPPEPPATPQNKPPAPPEKKTAEPQPDQHQSSSLISSPSPFTSSGVTQFYKKSVSVQLGQDGVSETEHSDSDHAAFPEYGDSIATSYDGDVVQLSARPPKSEHPDMRPAPKPEPDVSGIGISVESERHPNPRAEDSEPDAIMLLDLLEASGHSVDDYRKMLPTHPTQREAATVSPDNHGNSVQPETAPLPPAQQSIQMESPDSFNPGEIVSNWVDAILTGRSTMSGIASWIEEFSSMIPAPVKDSMVTWMEHMTEHDFQGERWIPAAYCSACFLAGRGRIGSAITLLESANRKNTGISQPFLMLGNLFHDNNLFSKALDNFRKFRDSGGNLKEVFPSWIRCLKESGEWNEILKELATLEPNSPAEIVLFKIEALAETGKLSEAAGLASSFMREVRSDADKANCALLAADLQLKSNNVENAIDFLDKAIELQPDNQQAQFQLGKLYLEHGAVPLGRNLLLTVIKRFPGGKLAEEAAALLGKEGAS